MALQNLWLEGIDVDAALYDVRDDDTQAWEVRALAGASIGIDPIAGLRAVIELSTAMERIVRGEIEGKTQLATILGVAMLTSKGASGVTGAGFITLAATLATIPAVPIESLAILVGIDRFMSECRALTNLVGNGVATLVVSRWEGEVSAETLRAHLRENPKP